jgi:cyclic pyranopterin phosphate synthase
VTAPTPKTTLALLCGGRSARLGTDKGLYQPLGDEPLVARAVRLLADDFAEVLVVVRDAAQAALYERAVSAHVPDAARANLRIVHDTMRLDVQPQAALAGVATALMTATCERVIILPIDQVGVRRLHLRRLSAGAPDGRAASFDMLPAPDSADSGAHRRPFPSLWPRATAERVDALIAAGALSIRRVLDELGAATLSERDFDAELDVNANTRAVLDDYFGAPLFDPSHRRLHYLRFSLTEACNLSCTYCLPDGFPEWKRHKARLGRDEIATLLAGFRRLGFRKVRFTGGEPTVHPQCRDALTVARKLGYERIALTTNGLLMQDLDTWIDAGLTELNVSLDSLDEDKFFAVTKSRQVGRVRTLIEAAAARGLSVKVNTVLLRSKNGDRANIESLIDWALDLPITLRFIELMETKLNGSFSTSERVLGSEIEPLLAARGLECERFDARAPDLRGPSTDYAHDLHPGRIGLINPMSCNFCSKCNRLRVTARGRLKLCLFGEADLPLELGSPAAVAQSVRALIGGKPERHYLEDGNVGNVATFRTIGG